VLLAGLLLVACGSQTGPGFAGTPLPARTPSPLPSPVELKLTSADLAAGRFPRDLTCDGAGRQPAITVAGLPAGTKAISLEMLDPDAPSGNFAHWLAIGDGPFADTVMVPPPGSHQGRNDAGSNGYTGPCPPSGVHHYHVIVLALAAPLGPAADGFSRQELDSAVSGAGVLGRGELVATYRRN
jgi:Raf kinase inhibitor-like YbhB/YbcL family protein